jgi:hypothetical protein
MGKNFSSKPTQEVILLVSAGESFVLGGVLQRVRNPYPDCFLNLNLNHNLRLVIHYFLILYEEASQEII